MSFASIDFDHLSELLILVADEFDQFFLRPDSEINAHGPRLRVRLRVVDRQIDLQLTIAETTEALGEFRTPAVWASDRCAYRLTMAKVL